MKNMKKVLVMTMAALLLVAVSVAGTVAYLTATTTPVVNTFAPTTIKITLQEHDYDYATDALGTGIVTEEDDYKMVPGDFLPKDPFVTVKAGSEKCYIFVKIEEVNDFAKYMKYYPDTEGENAKWGAIDSEEGVYYYKSEVDAAAADVNTTSVLVADAIEVLDSVTTAMLDELAKKDAADYPQLKITAYAVQSQNLGDLVWADDAAEIYELAIGN